MGAYLKQRYPITTTDWTPIAPPVDCNYFGLKNLDGSALTLRTDPDDEGTEDTLPAGMQEGVTAAGFATPNPYGHVSMQPRFSAGEPVLWVKATQGTGPVLVTWVL